MRSSILLLLGSGLLFAPAGCKGPAGGDGLDGSDGSSGTDGVDGSNGADGTDAVQTGDIAGTVRDADGVALDGATIMTNPATVTATSGADGSFSLEGINTGAYAVTATLAGYADATTAGVGVAASGVTSISVVMNLADLTAGTVTGTVLAANGDAVSGATVSIDGGTATTTSAADGTYALANVPVGSWYVIVSPGVTTLLDGETRESIAVSGGVTSSGVDITLSGRPTDSATYIGSAKCVMCHADEGDAWAASGHARSLQTDHDQLITPSLWPDVGGTVSTGQTGLSPVDGTSTVSFYACQQTAGVYSFKAGGTADCSVDDGTFLPIDMFYGGQGDGGVSDIPNVGAWKQRFQTKLANVPITDSWTYTAGKSLDSLTIPVQITQSGDGAPKFAGYHGTNWLIRERAFSGGCAACHNVGIGIETDADNDVTSYSYTDLNIGCETCHGPGSDHYSASASDKKLFIITQENLTALAARQACGMCHAADEGHAMSPAGAFEYPWNDANVDKVGNGVFVPGVYKLEDYLQGYGVPEEDGGGFASWKDGVHGFAHRQQQPMMELSVHTNNGTQRLVCTSCHDNHTLYQGPAAMDVVKDDGDFVFTSPTFADNTTCLACHAGNGPFADLRGLDVALNFMDAGGEAEQDGVALDISGYTDAEVLEARTAVAGVVSMHMQDKVGMGLVAYDPLDADMPVGQCESCHMPRVAKSGGWTNGVDANGDSALIHGDQVSHVMDIIWPYQSAALKADSGGADTDIMPNSCGACHEAARLSGN